MSEQDPKRLLEGSDARELRALLAAGKSEVPTDRQMLVLAAKIGIAGGLGGAGAAGAAGAGGAGAAGAGGAGGAGAAGAGGAGAAGAGGAGAAGALKAGLAVKVIGAVVIAGAAGTGAVVVSERNVERTPAPVGLVATESSAGGGTRAGAGAGTDGASEAVAAAPSVTASESAAEADAGAKAAVKTPPRPSANVVTAANAKDDGPEAEVKLVERAQDAVRARPAEALALCNDHAKRFPNGIVTQECEVISVEALVKLGRKDEARQRAARFKARFPGSAAIRRLDVLVAD